MRRPEPPCSAPAGSARATKPGLATRCGPAFHPGRIGQARDHRRPCVIMEKRNAMKIATFNVNGVNGRLPVLLRWLAEAAAGRRLPAGAEGAAGEVPRSGDPGRRLRRDLARPEELERRRHPGARRRAGRDPARPARRPGRRAQPLHRGGGRRRACRLPLPAERQSGAGPEVRLQAALVRAADRARRDAARERRAGRAGRRLQRHADRARRLQAGALGRRRAVPARGARRLSPAGRRRAGPTRCARCIRASGSTRSGTTSGTPLAATPACASTTCCSARRSPSALIAAGVDREVRGWEKASDHAPDLDRTDRQAEARQGPTYEEGTIMTTDLDRDGFVTTYGITI